MIAGVAALATLAACEAKRAQLVVTVRTDLQLPSQVSLDGARSPAASIDQVRVEILGADGAVQDRRDFLLQGEPFPLSFGVAPAANDPRVRVRVIGWRGAWASRDTPPIPSRGVSVERLVVVDARAVVPVNVSLLGDCVGQPSDLATLKTCGGAIDGAGGDPKLAPGSWTRATVIDCAQSAPDGAVCVPGGVSAIGDPALLTVDPDSDLVPAPPRMAALAPFWMDKLEVTVARIRTLVTQGSLGAAPPPTAASADMRCNFTPTPGAADGEPVRCVAFETAKAACAAWGAELPTVAQWEHAARNRAGTRYPWGDAPPTCCAGTLGFGLGCATGARNAGQHVTPADCDGLADVTRDGVVDLGGGVREWVKDAPTSLDACLPAGVLSDPVCGDASAGSTKGGSFATALERATASERRKVTLNVDVGFRCVRPAR